jgi:hypothetical protein
VLLGAGCLLAAAVPAVYFKDHDHRFWVGFDGSDHLAAFTGLSVGGDEPSRTVQTGVTRKGFDGEVDAEVLDALDQGVKALNGDDALRLAEALGDPQRYQELASPQVVHTGTATLAAGDCLADADDDAGGPELCRNPHAAEVYAVVKSPFHLYPDGEQSKPLKAFGDAACRWQFQQFVGLKVGQSELEPFERLPTRDDWDAGTRSVACLLRSHAELPLVGSVGASRRIFADYFPGSTGWAKAGNTDRCELLASNGETLALNKNRQQFSRRTGLRCVAVPPPTLLDPGLLGDVRLGVTPRFGGGSRSTDRVGFVCRQNSQAEYHLTIARDGYWRIQKKLLGAEPQRLNEGHSRFPADRLRTLQAVCSGGEDGSPVRLELWANNRRIGKAGDPGDPLPSGTAGVVIVADDPESFTGTFDDFTVASAA